MSKRIFIDGNINSELCIIATDGQEINYFDYSDELIASKKNNIYLGIVSRVEPSLQAAFIDFGSEKKSFLPFAVNNCLRLVGCKAGSSNFSFGFLRFRCDLRGLEFEYRWRC